MTDRLDGIGVFVQAVETGSFAAAAVKLNLSRSAVGKAVARLEARLGVRLFHRTTRSQSLSEDGQIYYERCLRALAELRAAEAMLESGRTEVIGKLRVTMPALFGRYCVAPILLALARQHPGLELELSFSDRIVDLVEEGFDLAIRNGALRGGSGLMTRRLAYQRMVVCASPSYLEANGTPASIADLDRHEAVLYWRADTVRSWLLPERGRPTAEIIPKARIRLDDLEAIADAAVAGAGLAWLPCWLIRGRVEKGELVCVLANQPGMVFETHAVWPQTPRLPLRTRLAIDALVSELPRLIEL
ncbi:LysR family transcriptional regulator [Bosea caraganae]|uniref:LysR family transcriptional regulator n=1 Tax=Bosea caraganae TaxID=2763117 RepID=A0A370LAI0_9HYPH|nr:LysR family transcriptional regulator [Bosea caraganae]RDJ21790.1 LysR family transcriptional regulator [Bosea caraganae]RDJ28180.1 LysR family transcriptional regulator [Bosea caraganae]